MLGVIGNSKYKRIAIMLGVVLVVLYGIENSFLINKIGHAAFSQWIKPSCLLITVFFIHYIIPKVHLAGKENYKESVYVWAFNCGIIYIVINILGGVLQGFGKSPYSHSLTGILANSFVIGCTLLGRESIRSYSVSSFMKRRNKWALIYIILLMTLTNIRSLKFMGINDLKTFTIFCAEVLIPEFCSNILATYLVLYGGKWASVIYLGLIESAMWFSPILPALNWLAKGVIGMIVPIFCLLYVVSAYRKRAKEVKVYKEKQDKWWQWVPEAVGAVLLIWFAAGVFSVYPSVIATGSMEPLIKPGDVILVEKIKDMDAIKALTVDDVIQFKRGEILITHRIVEVLEENGVICYRTKGDNNSANDSEVVKAGDVKGILKHVVPKVGWPTLIFKSAHADGIDEVEF